MLVSKLPPNLASILDGYDCNINTVGKSTAKVYRYHKKNGNALYLKISHANMDFKHEHEKLLWLDGRLPVPTIKLWHIQDGLAYLLMTQAPGQVLFDCLKYELPKPYEDTVKLLADALLMLQAVDTTGCPFDNTLNIKLARALSYIEAGQVDINDWDGDTYFETPMDLHRWLISNKPKEEICFTHGDYDPRNIFSNGIKPTCFIDVGECGLADKWQDIALCVRTIKTKTKGISDAEKDGYVDLLFSYLGIEPDWAKVKYYNLLCELF